MGNCGCLVRDSTVKAEPAKSDRLRAVSASSDNELDAPSATSLVLHPRQNSDSELGQADACSATSTSAPAKLRAVNCSSDNNGTAWCAVGNVLDGHDFTAWCSRRRSGEEWLLFDAGEERANVDRVDFQHWEDGCRDLQAKDCELLFGPTEDGPWESALSFATSQATGWQRFLGARGCGRYWKLRLITKHGDAGCDWPMYVRGVKLFVTPPVSFVLTLHVGDAGPDRRAAVSCTNIGGDEVACVDACLDEPVHALWSLIRAALQDERADITTMLPDGRMMNNGGVPLAAALKGGARAPMNASAEPFVMTRKPEPEPQKERRVAFDGRAYTMQEFLDFFGEAAGREQWSQARPWQM